MSNQLTIRRPDDWHLHLRDGAVLKGVLPWTARSFARAIVMPNLVPPVVTARDAAAYRDRILAALPDGMDFEPLMTLYLTEDTDPQDVRRAASEGLVKAVKLYPAGATTNSASGVRDIGAVRAVLETMAEIGLPLCVHGEVTDPGIDIFDREAVFVERVLDPTRRATPGLRVVMEHITTREAADYVASGDETLAATITVQHLALNRNAIFRGGLRPVNYCLPVLKREEHRQALLNLATGTFERVFLGTDSAPHTDAAKYQDCGCAGCFTAPVALGVLADIFEEQGVLDRLESFVSIRGALFYGMPLNETTITLARGTGNIPDCVDTADGPVTVWRPEGPIGWHVA